jgi:hypothetical protein
MHTDKTKTDPMIKQIVFSIRLKAFHSYTNALDDLKNLIKIEKLEKTKNKEDFHYSMKVATRQIKKKKTKRKSPFVIL